MGEKEQSKEKIRDYYHRSMPYCDRTDVDHRVLEAYAEHACWLRENVDWCRALPEDIFLEHVAAYRINNEKIEDCRKRFCDMVLPCIWGMPLKDAVLEVNLWCSAHVSYHPADDRTAGPLTVYRSGFGRCGEESVFTVTVLRSVGIAARQVYAPLWSHCDDNHAWVEVYCEGQWHYLGACEPEPVLDKGWFDQVSSRAMLIHARSFFGDSGKERVISREGCAAFYCVTDRYARTSEVTFLLSLPDGTVLRRTAVELEVLNYAHYGKIARLTTDEQGQISLPLGLGSVRIACAQNGHLYCKDVNISGSGQIAVTLLRPQQERWIGSFFKTPKGAGPEKENAAAMSPEDRAEFADRTEQAKEARRKRLASFWQEEIAAKFPGAEDILRQAGENFDELAAFLGRDHNPYRLKLLKALPVKDTYDVRADVLEEHLKYAMPYADKVPEDIFVNDLLNPRAAYEELGAYREEILRSLGGRANEFAGSPEKIWTEYCEGIEQPCEDAYDTLCKLPLSVLRDRKGSKRDRNNLFVAIARSCGIPARLNPVTKEPEYYRNGSFYPAEPRKREAANGKVILKAEPGARYVCPGNFSFARWEKDHYQVWDLSRAVWKDGELVLEGRQGDYRIVAVQRLEDGSQLAKEFYFTLGAKERCIRMERPEYEEKQKSAAALPKVVVKQKVVPQQQGQRQQEISPDGLQNGGRVAYLWIREGEEPTEHLLHELLERAGEAAGYRDQIFILSEKNALENGLLQRLQRAVGGLHLYVAENFEKSRNVAEVMELEISKYPLAVVVDEDGRGVYGTCGYHVGAAAMILERL